MLMAMETGGHNQANSHNTTRRRSVPGIHPARSPAGWSRPADPPDPPTQHTDSLHSGWPSGKGNNTRTFFLNPAFLTGPTVWRSRGDKRPLLTSKVHRQRSSPPPHRHPHLSLPLHLFRRRRYHHRRGTDSIWWREERKLRFLPYRVHLASHE